MDSLFQEDQKYRLELSKLKKEKAPKKMLDSFSALIKTKGSSNLVFVEKWINKHWWLGPQEIGFIGVQALFLVIQQDPEEVLSLLKKAESEGNIISSNVAILEDWIAVRESWNQTYGSQFYVDSEKRKTLFIQLKA